MKIFDMVPFDGLVPIDKSSRTTTILVLKSRVFTITSLVFDVKMFVVVDVSHQEILLFMCCSRGGHGIGSKSKYISC